MDLPKRFIERSGVSLTSYEKPHILREPPKAVWTRKKERVSEADVTWMTRPGGDASDPTRINQAISYYSKGVNPSVEISYASHGGGGSATTSLHNVQSGSVYKIKNVRPPLFPVETTLPISRPRTHQNKAVSSVPGLSAAYSTSTNAYSLDTSVVKNAVTGKDKATLPITVQSTSTYKVQLPEVMSARWAINENRPSNYAAVANPSRNIKTEDFICREKTPYGVIIRPKAEAFTNLQYETKTTLNNDASSKVRESMLIENVRPNFQVIVYDPTNHISTEVAANIKDKTNIAVRAAKGMPITLTREDGTHIKLKNVLWTAVQTNAGADRVILTIAEPDVQLERNIPLYSAEGTYAPPTDVMERVNGEYDLEGKIGIAPSSNIVLPGYGEDSTRNFQDMVKVADRLPFSSFENPANHIPMYNGHKEPQIRGVKDANMMMNAGSESFKRMFE